MRRTPSVEEIAAPAPAAGSAEAPGRVPLEALPSTRTKTRGTTSSTRRRWPRAWQPDRSLRRARRRRRVHHPSASATPSPTPSPSPTAAASPSLSPTPTPVPSPRTPTLSAKARRRPRLPPVAHAERHSSSDGSRRRLFFADHRADADARSQPLAGAFGYAIVGPHRPRPSASPPITIAAARLGPDEQDSIGPRRGRRRGRAAGHTAFSASRTPPAGSPCQAARRRRAPARGAMLEVRGALADPYGQLGLRPPSGRGRRRGDGCTAVPDVDQPRRRPAKERGSPRDV